jgi:hypothetical protein
MANNTPGNTWPVLQYSEWKDTLATMHLFTQIVGKIRLRNMPWLNHSWHVTFYISATGLTTGSIPYDNGVFQIDFNFITHEVIITTSTGEARSVRLYPRSVASFYNELLTQLEAAGIETYIYAIPNEIDPAIPFAEDEVHQSYDAAQVQRYWQALVKVHNVFLRFRAGFTGKCSPVHLFWGAFDLAVTRFSGRRAPQHTGGAPNMPLRVMQEAYSHEVSSCGFWPGSDQFPQAMFYSYCYPTPEAFGKQPVAPEAAYYSSEMGEFILPYEAVQQAGDPEIMLLNFLQSTYNAAANTGNWNRHELECDLTRFEQ